jgi:hypothetical protein
LWFVNTQRRYDIDISLLKYYSSLAETILYPRRFCSNGKRFYGRINLVDTGHVRLMTIGAGKRKNLYCLSATGKGIVAEFYECLVGETKIPEYKIKSMAKPKATAFDKKRMEMIKELIRLPFPITRNRF